MKTLLEEIDAEAVSYKRKYLLNHIVNLRVDPVQWDLFLLICHEKDVTASQVLRNYINMIVSKKYSINEKLVIDNTLKKEV